MRGEITKYCFYQTLSMYLVNILNVAVFFSTNATEWVKLMKVIGKISYYNI